MKSTAMKTSLAHSSAILLPISLPAGELDVNLLGGPSNMQGFAKIVRGFAKIVRGFAKISAIL